MPMLASHQLYRIFRQEFLLGLLFEFFFAKIAGTPSQLLLQFPQGFHQDVLAYLFVGVLSEITSGVTCAIILFGAAKISYGAPPGVILEFHQKFLLRFSSEILLRFLHWFFGDFFRLNFYNFFQYFLLKFLKIFFPELLQSFLFGFSSNFLLGFLQEFLLAFFQKLL